MKRVILFVAFIFYFYQLYPQINQPQRFEVELNTSDNHFTVIPAGKDGMALVRESSERGWYSEAQYEIVKLDTALNQEWAKNYSIDYRLSFRGYDYHDGSIILLFVSKYTNKNELTIFKIDGKTSDMEKFELLLDVTVELSHFEMVGESAILGGYINYRPAIFMYNLSKKRLLALRGFYIDRSEIIQINVDDDKEIFHVLATIRTFDRVNTIMMKTFDKNGELLNSTTLRPEEDYSLLYGQATTTNSGELLIAGAFSKTRSTKQGKESYSAGIFIAKVDEWGEQSINYYNYANLDNFFNYMRAGKQKRVQAKIERKKIRGKQIRFNYRLLVHSIIQKNNGDYIMVGEAYYPTTITRSGFGSGFYSYPTYSQAIKGYQYTHAVVIGFNSAGKLIWDNSFEINDVESFRLEKFVHADVRDDKIILFYNFKNVIRTKIIEGEDVLEGKSSEDIMLKLSDDVVDNNDNLVGGLEEWYDNNFIAYGIQRLKKVGPDPQRRRRDVFFVNKIYYK
jgi:hypothetical protein